MQYGIEQCARVIGGIQDEVQLKYIIVANFRLCELHMIQKHGGLFTNTCKGEV